MLKTSLKRFFSFFCSICFISNLFSNMIGNSVSAAVSCMINVIGYSYTDESSYVYESNTSTSGTMSVSYKLPNSDEEFNCTPDRGATITDIPPGATVTFSLQPQTGFTPSLKINNNIVDLTQADDNKYTGTIVDLQATQTDVEAVFSPQEESNSQSIVVNLKYVEGQELKSGTYDDKFKEKWATVEYSTDGGTTYSPLSQGTTIGEDGSYIFDSDIESIDLRLTWSTKILALIDANTAENGKAVKLEKGSHTVVFQEAIYTVIWLYTGEGVDESAITKHGKVAIKKGDGIDGQEDSTGGLYVVTPGTEVTMTFTPDYGYQFNQSTISENIEVTPATDACTYTFTMPEDYVIVGDIFTENPDTINLLTSAFTSASILNASDVISAGNAELTIDDAIITKETKKQINSLLSENGLTPLTYFSMELNQFFTKGDTGENWETMLSTTKSPVKITLTLDDSLKGQDTYSVVRIDDNQVTPLNTEYNASDGTISFETDKFSEQYALCVGKNSNSAIASISKVVTGDNNNLLLYSLVALAAIAGFICTFKLFGKNKSKM